MESHYRQKFCVDSSADVYMFGNILSMFMDRFLYTQEIENNKKFRRRHEKI